MKKSLKYYENVSKEYQSLTEKIDSFWNTDLGIAKIKWNKEVEDDMKKSLWNKIFGIDERDLFSKQFVYTTNRIEDFRNEFNLKNKDIIDRKNKCKSVLKEVDYPLSGETLTSQGLVNFIKFVGGKK